MATLFVYAADDGVLDSPNPTWTTARDGTGSKSASAPVLFGAIACDWSGSSYECAQYFAEFQENTLVAGDTITGAQLQLHGNADFSTTDFTVKIGLYGWNGALEGVSLDISEWRTKAQLDAMTLFGVNFLSTAGWNTSGYNIWTVSEPRLAGIKGAITHIIAFSSRNQSTTAPTTAERVTLRGKATSGTTQDPVLVITYTDSSQTLNLTGVPSPWAVGTATFNVEQNLALTGVPSPAAVGTAAFDLVQDVALTGVASPAAVGTTTVTAGDVDLALTGVPSAGAAGTATFDVEQLVALTGVPSVEVVGVAVVELVTILALTGIPSLAGVGSANVTGEPPAAIIALVHPLHLTITDNGRRGLEADDDGRRSLLVADDHRMGLDDG